MSTLILEKHQIRLEYETDVLVVRDPDLPMRTIPLCRLDKIICLHNTELTTQLLGQLQKRSIDFIVLNNRYDSHSVAIYGDKHGNSIRRCQQYAMQLSEQTRLPLAKTLCQHKFLVSLRTVQQLNTNKLESQIEMALENLWKCQTEEQLRGLEGSVQRGLFQLWRSQLNPAWGFEQRARRPPPDPVNALLSLTYTLVHQEAVRQAIRFGLDPMLGFYHRLAYNRQSLACDLMEPVRPRLESWLVQTLESSSLNRRHFSKAKTEGCYLGKEGRLLFYPLLETQMPAIRRCLAASARWCTQQLKQSHIQPLYDH